MDITSSRRRRRMIPSVFPVGGEQMFPGFTGTSAPIRRLFWEGSQQFWSWKGQALLSGGLCRYGNSVECCWGWRQTDGGRCQPHCQQGCKHGECVAPDVCKCRPGYAGKACNQDLNECGLKPRPCKHRCVNTPGSFKCFCPDGFWLHPDGGCRNARTCYHANCQYGCEVMKGEVRCTCPSPGLRLGPDRRTCVDMDECVSGGGVCPRRRKCVNTFGSFFCKCHLGFRLVYLDGRYACIDKDSRTFCSLNPSSPKCRCGNGSCDVIPRVIIEPQRPGTATPTNTAAMTTATTPTPTPTTRPTTPCTSSTTVTTALPITTITTRTTVMTTTPPAPSSDAATTTTITRPRPTTTTTTTAAPSTTTVMMTTTTSTTVVTTSSTAPTTPPPTTTTTSTGTLPTVAMTTSLVTITVNNRINKDVTQKQRGDVHIPRQPGHNQVLELDIELGNTAEDLGDDPEVDALRCSFDDGLCDWMSERDGDVHWEVVHHPAGGAYLSVPELKVGQQSIRGARLAIRVDPPWSYGNLCFTFSHWLSGHHVGVLQLFVKGKGRGQRYGSALWSRTGGHGWRHMQLTLTSHSVDRVLLKAERRRGHGGQIAVADVILRQGAC
ncbi:nephronectin-like [Xenentodon cancila]